MPGLGRKTFIATEVLTAANVNGYLMDQSVMVFAGTAARSSAIGTASAGMVSYRTDANILEYYNGSAWTAVDTTTVVPQGNAIINGAFDIWQRGTSGTVSANETFAADRWRVNSGGGGVLAWSQQTFTPGQTDVPGNPNYFLRCNYTTSGTGAILAEIHLEDVTTYAGQTATLSFYGKVSTGTKSVTPRLVQNFGSGGSTTVLTNLSAVTLTTSWQRFTLTSTVPSVSGKTIGAGNYLRIDLDNGTSGVLTYDLANFQFELGSTATTFKRSSPTLQAELAACQRYYWRAGGTGNNAGAYSSYSSQGYVFNSTTAYITVNFPVTMRIAPTSIEYSGICVNDSINASWAPTSITIDGSLPSNASIVPTISGATAGRYARLINNNNTSGYLGFSAEL